MDKKPLTGQHKVNLVTGKITVVASKATENPSLERQGNLMDWANTQDKLNKWTESKTDGA